MNEICLIYFFSYPLCAAGGGNHLHQKRTLWCRGNSMFDLLGDGAGVRERPRCLFMDQVFYFL